MSIKINALFSGAIMIGLFVPPTLSVIALDEAPRVRSHPSAVRFHYNFRWLLKRAMHAMDHQRS
jgi:hypothetical protein